MNRFFVSIIVDDEDYNKYDADDSDVGDDD